MKAAWVDGSFDNAISPHDAGFLLGHGVFETVGVFDGRLPLWRAHLRRLARNAEAVGIPFSPPDELREAARELLAREVGDDVLRITLTAGVAGRPTWCLTTRRRGAAGAVRLQVVTRDVPEASIKTTSRLGYTLAMQEAQASGAHDALLVTSAGLVTETTTGNVFFWKDEVLHTPRLDGGLLPGVAREAIVAELADRVRVAELDYGLPDFAESDGFFTTNAVHGPRPATLGSGAAVPLRPLVVEAWQRAVATTN